MATADPKVYGTALTEMMRSKYYVDRFYRYRQTLPVSRRVTNRGAKWWFNRNGWGAPCGTKRESGILFHMAGVMHTE
jgi:hypothetical protein